METDLDDTFLNTNDNTIVISSSQSDNSDTNIGQSEKENTIAEQIDDQNTNIGQNLIDADIDKIGDGDDGLPDETQDDPATDQPNSTDEESNPLDTRIIVKNASVVKERKLVLQLLDSNNNTIANKKVAVTFNKKTYTDTTDENGKISLKISLEPGKYTVFVKFAGDENFTQANKTFTMKVYKLKTNFSVPKTSIIRGQYFYAYLKDKNNNPLASKTVIITLKNKKFIKKTNKNGRIRLKINLKLGKYKIKLSYKGSKTYIKSAKNLTIKSYRAKTKISFESKEVIQNKYLVINLKYGKNKKLSNKKLSILFAKKRYKRTTDKEGKVKLKLTKPMGSYNVKVSFYGTKGFKKSSKVAKIRIYPNYTIKFSGENKTVSLKGTKAIKYSLKLTDLNGNPIIGENVTIKVKCNNFTAGSGNKITKKTIVLSSDNIETKKLDKKRLKKMAKMLRAKGYKVIISGIGPNYHVTDVKKYKNVCVFSLVGGIDSGMFVDMANGYYQSYLKRNNNQFVLGCVDPPKDINLANRTWLKRAHDDNYSPRSFKGLYFPGKYLNKKTKVDYVYGTTPEDLVNNFLKYGKKGKSIGLHNSLPGTYVTYKLTTSKNGYVHLDLPIGNHTIISSFDSENKYASLKTTRWVNVIK